jgi:U3 small nucleolar RNA-associated protein 15
MTGHADYIRAAACNPANIDVWATGSYDHVCKLWDVRSISGGNNNSSSKPTMSFDHGAPIESLAFFPSGSLLVTAGGTKLCIWDLYSGGRLLKTLTNHQKTVTSVLVSSSSYSSGGGESSSSSSSPRLLSGSLDGHVKVYDMDTFQVTHASKYPAPVLSLGLSSNNKYLAVGMADGTLSVRRHSGGAKRAAGTGSGNANSGSGNRRAKYKPRLTAASYRYFIRGQSSKAAADDLVVAKKKKAALGQYDRLLRKFRYREALDAALATRRPEIVATVVEELAARGGLRAALADRDDAAGTGMISLLDYLKRAVGDPRHSGLAADLGHRVLDVYGGGRAVVESGGVMEKMEVLRERVKVELQTQDELVKIRGMLEPLLACSVGV